MSVTASREIVIDWETDDRMKYEIWYANIGIFV